MAKKMTNRQDEPSITVLTIDKSEFHEKLEERIKIGVQILNRTINTNQGFEQMKFDYTAWNDYNSEYLKQSFNTPFNEYKESYDNAGHSWSFVLEVEVNPVHEKKELIRAKIENLINLSAKTDILKSSENVQSIVSKNTVKSAMDEVFIVHGHDEEAKAKTARFIEKLGFKPIILHEQASSGDTIIEKIEEYSNVGFGIVLYTPCDIGGKQVPSPILKSRARQNVVFEHGYLIGKIGRKNVCALVKGDIEKPNDISGVVYIPMDDNDAWHIKLARELKKSNYKVDLNKII
jgi:predicted nucleotide-binding protein